MEATYLARTPSQLKGLAYKLPTELSYTNMKDQHSTVTIAKKSMNLILTQALFNIFKKLSDFSMTWLLCRFHIEF